MASRNVLTFEKLLALLTDLGFTIERTPNGYRTCRHSASDTWMVFADRATDGPVREADVVAVRKQLTERGLIAADEFERWLAELDDTRSQRRIP